MGHSDYPLQALLYAVVLHRFLRWRQPGYDPDASPRRRPLPLPARHVRAGDAAGRRRARAECSRGGRRSRWSRSCPTCSTAASMTERDDRDLRAGRTTTTGGSWRAPPGCSATSTGPACCRRPTSTSPPARRPRGRGRRGGAAGRRARRPRRARGSVGVDLATIRDIAPDLPWPDADAWARRGRGVAPDRGRGAAPASSAWSTSTATPARAAGRRRPRRRAPASRRRRRRGGAGRRARPGLARRALHAEQEAAAVAACRQLDHGAHRRTRHRQDDHGGPAARAARRPGRPADRCRIALAAPTGKAAARLPGGRRATRCPACRRRPRPAAGPTR